MLTRFTRRPLWLAGVLLLGSTAPLLCTHATAAATPPPIVETEDFDQWLGNLRSEALSLGIAPQLFDRLFVGMSPDDSVIQADGNQPEFSRPVWDYLDSAASPARVHQGREQLNSQRATLDALERSYGVERNILVAIWGMESNFGGNIGSKDVIRSLATLAWHGRRAEFARKQLLAALQIVQEGHYRGPSLPGSWAGAMGQTQFMPTTFRDFAVDFDRDGRKNLWYSTADALASTANYLQRSGWQSGQRWGQEVFLPAGFDYAQADPQVRKPVSQWLALGVQPTRALRASELTLDATLLLPAGHRGPAFLVQGNFRTLLVYNNSTAYALGVALLAERLAGGGELRARWPLDETPLSRSQRIELQERLAAQGYNPGIADGIIGANTRAAVRASQQKLGWPADGQPTLRLLEILRQQR